MKKYIVSTKYSPSGQYEDIYLATIDGTMGQLKKALKNGYKVRKARPKEGEDNLVRHHFSATALVFG
jgi:hypothetical protein